jgi:hypothetical protein
VKERRRDLGTKRERGREGGREWETERPIGGRAAVGELFVEPSRDQPKGRNLESGILESLNL